VRDEDSPSDFKYFILVSFNVLSIPICESLNPKLYVLHRKYLILFKNIRNGVHDVKGFINIFKVGILVFQGKHIILFSFMNKKLSSKLLRIKFR
jgi:hypothetical protein